MANDILEVLAEDHRRVEGLLETLASSSDPNECLSLLHDLTMELVPHMRGEERLVYPRLKQEPAGRGLEDEAEEQHAMAEELLGELVGMALGAGDGSMQDADGFQDKVTQLTMAIEQHVTFEEGEIFEVCREAFDDAQLADLGVEFEDMKLEVQGTIEQVAAGATFQEAGAEGSQPSA